MIEQAGFGVRFGSGSIYDWVAEEIFTVGSEDSEGMGDDKKRDTAVAMQMLAAFRRRKALRRLVERAFDEVEQDIREGRFMAPPVDEDSAPGWPAFPPGRRPRPRTR